MINIKNILLAIFGALSGVIAIYFAGKKRGGEQHEAEQTKRQLQEGLELKKDIDKIRNSSDDVIDDILRKDARE